jgi:hypothetical protein
MTGRRDPVGADALESELTDLKRRLSDIERLSTVVRFLIGTTIPGILAGTYVAGKPYLVQAGSNVDPDSDANHTLVITFPKAFPNCLITVLATLGDTTQGFVGIYTHTYSLSSFAVARGGGTTAWRMNWIAIGQ